MSVACRRLFTICEVKAAGDTLGNKKVLITRGKTTGVLF